MKNIWNLKNTYKNLPKDFYQEVLPTAVTNASGLLFNYKLAKEIQLAKYDSTIHSTNISDNLYPKELVDIFSGNDTFEGLATIAQAYAGHQFGHFTKLGDGRAVLLGEYNLGKNKLGDDELIDIQLKGSGPTAFSRRGDGRAALGPMLREYIISEAMHYLNIPTTRSLSICLSGEPVYREDLLKGAVLTRLAKSHIRVGTFEYALAFLKTNDLKKISDYVIDRHFSNIKSSENPYKDLLMIVIEKQASLIAKWMKYGFIHGVMNTDNVSIVGETIDYGPCAFMEAYNPNQVYSSIDRQGRYAYNNQPNITYWNLACFAETLLPLLDDDSKKAIDIAQDCLSVFKTKFESHWYKEMLAKLGIEIIDEENKVLLKDLFKIMEKNSFDFTNTFLHLTYDFSDYNNFNVADLDEWKKRWIDSLKKEPDTEKTKKLMKKHNPLWIARNHLVEKALEMAENDDLGLFLDLLEALREPFSKNDKYNKFQKPAGPSDKVYQTFCGT